MRPTPAPGGAPERRAIAQPGTRGVAEPRPTDLLRFVTVGSVDDGKSTLIGRLLHDSHALCDDHLAALRADSARLGTAAGGLDFALVTDGLRVEREQGITVDVAYRHFATARRSYLIADAPGHEQYTRNMVTAASTADLAVILIDARRGVSPQTRRHAVIASLLGIRRVLVAVNKMDLVAWSEAVFRGVVAEFGAFAARLRGVTCDFVPIAALGGDNVVRPSDHMARYGGPSLLEHLDTVSVRAEPSSADMRFPVAYVIRTEEGFRGYAGQIASGSVRPGDPVVVLPSMAATRVKPIETFDGELEHAVAPQSVTLTLADELDLSRGDMIAPAESLPRRCQRFDAMVVWLDAQAMVPRRAYLLRHTSRSTRVEIERIDYRLDPHTLSAMAAAPLQTNEVARLRLQAHAPLFVDAYEQNRRTGSFILVDPESNATVAAGMIVAVSDEPSTDGSESHTPLAVDRLRVAAASSVEREAREGRLGQRAVTLWLTGLSGSGKSSIGRELERRLFEQGRHACLLDGDDLRLGLNRDLGFSPGDRAENVRRVAHLARLFNDAGLIAIVPVIAPFAADREEARRLVGAEHFLECHVATPLEVCEARDAKGLYALARAGRIAEFTGLSSPYETPPAPWLRLDTTARSLADCCDELSAALSPRIALHGSAERRSLREDTDAIVVVSGLPRSGTSLMMSMLGAGGIELVTDGVRVADVDNPRGYFEFERVKSLATDSAWLAAAGGKAVKVISALLEHLPRAHRYKVVFMRRDLDEVLASQARMLEHRGVVRRPRDPRLVAEFTAHLAAVEALLRGDGAFDVLDVSYRALCTSPGPEIERVARFLGVELDRAAMRACIEPSLYRGRGR